MKRETSNREIINKINKYLLTIDVFYDNSIKEEDTFGGIGGEFS